MSDEPDLEDVLADAFPRCEHDGTLLEPYGEGASLHWACPTCGAVAISR